MRTLLALIVLLVPPATTARSTPNPADAPEAEGRALTGILRPSRVVRVGSASDGVLAEVLVERGDRVSQGQVLARLDVAVEGADAELARARAARTAEREIAATRHALARRQLERQEALWAEGLVTEDELDVARDEARLAHLTLLDAEERIEIARLEHARALAALHQGTLRSPIDGVVTERLLGPGELLSRSGRSEVLTLAQLDPLEIEVHAPLELWGRIEEGATLGVRFPRLSLGRREATVAVVDRVVDAASSTFQVRLELSNAGHEVPAGVRCEVELDLGP